MRVIKNLYGEWEVSDALYAAYWSGDLDKLRELAPCDCCCGDHFYEGCPAVVWDGCRGDRDILDAKAWAAHYGMTEEEFLCLQ